MRYEILGPLEVRDEARVISLARGRLRLLLGVLLLRANEVISSELLIDALWGESPPPAAAGSLHNLTAALRKALGEGALVTRAGGYVLVVGEDELDAWHFQALAEQGREALAAGEPARAAGLLREGLALWRGRRWPISPTRPRCRRRSRDWLSCGWRRWRSASRPTSPSAATANSSRS